MSTEPPLQPFRFMDLLVELRLMVYERMPRQIRHTKFMDVILVYAESHVIVLCLIRAFVQESQPKIIGSDIYLSGLRRLRQSIVNECRAFQDNKDCSIDAIVERNRRVNLYPWCSDLRHPNVARFLHQTIRALVPGETTWNNSVAAVGFMQHHGPNANLIEVHHLWRGDLRMRLRGFQQSRYATLIGLKDEGMLVKGLNGEVEVTADNVPVVWDHDISSGLILVSSMSRETWVGEWLP